VSIKAVTIKGFKTFANRTELKLSDRLTAVVGPNGSGKSNLVDAIRWGIGEKTTSLLRIGRPSEVIFAGLGDKKPLSAAEVTIELDNSAGVYPVDADMAIITRRIFRSGESEFEISGEKCRLKDIENLFRGTGLGKQTYSVVGQGEVDLVLAATPGERLTTMEELAGVDVMKATKRSVEAKIEKAQGAMAQIHASVSEQKHNYERLQVQAEILKKYEQIRERASHLRLQLLLIESRELSLGLESLSSKISMIKIKGNESQDELNLLEGNTNNATKLSELAKNRDVAQKEREGAIVVQTRVTSELEHMQEKSKEIEAELHNNLLNIESANGKIVSRQTQTKNLMKAIADLEEDYKTSRGRLEEIENSSIGVGENKSERTKLQSILDKVKRETNQIRSELSSCESKLTIQRERYRQSTETLSKLESQEMKEAPSLSDLPIKLADIIKQIDTNVSEVEDIRGNLDKLTVEQAQNSAETRTINSEISNLNKTLERLEFLPSSCGYPLLHEKVDLSKFSDEQKNLIQNQLDWIVVEKDKAFDLPNVVPEGVDTTIVVGDVDVEFCDSLGESLETSRSIAITKDGFITLKGKFISRAREKISESSIKSRIEELEKSLKDKTNSSLELQEKINRAKQEIEQKNQQTKDLRVHEHELSKNISSIEAQIIEVEKSEQKRQSDIKSQKENGEKLTSQIKELEGEFEELQNRLTVSIQASRDAGKNLSDFDEKSLQAHKERADFERKLAEAKANLNKKEIELRDAKKELEGSTTEIESLKEQINQTQERCKALEIEGKEIAGRIIEGERTLNTAKMTIMRTERIEKECQEGRENLESEEEERQKQIKTIGARISRYSKETHQIELEMMEKKTKKERVINDIIDFGGDPNAYIEDTDVESMKFELSNCTRQLAEYGAVNLTATDEARKAEERLNFLDGQLSDLGQTEANLRSSLQEVEARINESFESVYRSVEKEFRRLADVLFSGAEGNLKRIKDDDGTTIGVHVEFMLPGRRMRSLQSLSGGEKTLGALALLFAFFRTKSSPFCILDEVDAALDDANVERFTNLLRTEAKDTQFVVITHNKETMKWCDALYGITLDSSGTSKVVGVKLDEKYTRE